MYQNKINPSKKYITQQCKTHSVQHLIKNEHTHKEARKEEPQSRKENPIIVNRPRHDRDDELAPKSL